MSWRRCTIQSIGLSTAVAAMVWPAVESAAQSQNPPSPTTAILEVDAPKGSTIYVGGKDRGKATTFTYRNLPVGKIYKFTVMVAYPGGAKEWKWINLRGGWRVRVPFRPRRKADRPQLAMQTGHTGRINSVTFSSDGALIVTSSFDKTVVIWDAHTGLKLNTIGPLAGPATSAVFSLDGTRVAAVTNGFAAVWHVATGRKLLTLKDRLKRPRNVAFAMQGKVLVTCSSGMATVWDANTGKKRLAFRERKPVLGHLAISPDGERAATDILKGAIVWDLASGKILRELTGHKDTITAIAFSPDGKRLLTGSWDKTAKVWNIATGRRVLTLDGYGRKVECAAFLGNDRIVTATSNAAIVWDGLTARKLFLLRGHANSITSTAASLDGRRIVTGSWDKTSIIWDAGTGKRLRTLRGRERTRTYAFSRDGNRTAVQSGRNAITIWDGTQRRTSRELRGHSDHILCAVFSKDGKRIITGSKHRSAIVWDCESGKNLLTFVGLGGSVVDAAFRPDGKRVLTVSGDGAVTIWDGAAERKVRTLRRGGHGFASARYSADGSRILTASGKAAIVWEADTGRSLLTLSDQGRVTAASYGRSDQWIVTESVLLKGSRTTIWNVRTKQKLRDFPGQFLALSLDGDRIATASDSRSVTIWDAGNGTELVRIKDVTGVAGSVAFSPDGRLLAGESQFGDPCWWDTATGDKVASLIVLGGGAEWVLVTPDGLFDGSENGRRLVGYRVAGRVVPVDRFFTDFYRPGLFPTILGGDRSLPDVQLSRELPPVVRITSPKSGAVDQPRITITGEAEDQGGGVSGPFLMHNGARVLARGAEQRIGKIVKRTFTIDLVQGENRITLKATSGDGTIESASASVAIQYARPVQKPNLFVLAAGINQYKERSLSLQYAAQDAKAIANLFQKRAKSLYRDVTGVTLLDDQVTKKNLRNALNRIAAKAKPQDTLIVFLAGHGTMVHKRYYFIPADFHVSKSRSLSDDIRAVGVPADVIGDYLTRVPALKRILILDTCNSGGALNNTRSGRDPLGFPRAIARLSRAQGVFTIAASAAGDEAQEVKELGHGVLTYALLAGLGAVKRGPLQDRVIRPNDPDQVVSVLEWFNYADGHVPNLTRRYFGHAQSVEMRSQGRSFPVLPVED